MTGATTWRAIWAFGPLVMAIWNVIEWVVSVLRGEAIVTMSSLIAYGVLVAVTLVWAAFVWRRRPPAEGQEE